MNLPPQFLKRMNLILDSDAGDFYDSLGLLCPVSIRVQTGKIQGSLPLDPVPWVKKSFYLPYRPLFTLDPYFHAGCYYVQEASSMLIEQAVEQLLPSDKPLNLLDLCAAPGGKTTHLMGLMRESSLLVSNEVIRNRSWILAENVTKRSGTNVVVSNNDPADFAQLGEFFDAIFVDAPCSGEGLFRRDEESIHQWSVENLKLCSQRQRRILNDALHALKVGGVLVYSTCTYNPEENEEIVRWLIAENGYELLSLDLDPSWGFSKVEVEDGVAWQAYPHRVRGEGFFLAVLRKVRESKFQSSRSSEKATRKKKRRKSRRCGSCEDEPAQSQSRKSFEKTTRKNAKELSGWVTGEADLRWIERRDEVHAISENLAETVVSLDEKLKIIGAGVEVGTRKKHGFVPAHALALSSVLKPGATAFEELAIEQALQYLRREPISTSLPDGVGLVAFEGQPLGWVKQIGNRSNNWYPNEWRIRMSIPDGEIWTLSQEFSKL